MYTEVAWVLVSSGTQVQPEIILDPNYFPDYLSISYDYDSYIIKVKVQFSKFNLIELDSHVQVYEIF